MRSTFVLASFVLQLVVTPEDGLGALSLTGALCIVVSVVLILATKRPPATATATAPVLAKVGAAGRSDDPAWLDAPTACGGELERPRDEMELDAHVDATAERARRPRKA